MSVTDIPLELIDDPPFSLRQVRKDTVEYMEMVMSIKERGIDNSILVRPVGDRFQRADGGHRVAACREIGLVTIPAIVREMTDSELLSVQFTNALRVSTSRTEYAAHLLRIKKANPKMTMAQLVHITGKSSVWIRQQLSLLELHAKCEQALNMGLLPALNAYELAKIPKHLQVKLLRDACSDMKTTEFRAIVAEHKRQLSTAFIGRREAAKDQFKPHRYFRSLKEVEKEVGRGHAAANLLAEVQPKTKIEAFRLALAWVTNSDPITLQQRLDKFNSEGLNQITDEERNID